MAQARKWWESSVEAGKVSMRLRGVLVAAVPVVVLLFNVEQEGVTAVVDATVDVVAAVGTLVGIAISVYGYVRRKK